MPNDTCTAADCVRPVRYKALCNMHYQRQRKAGMTAPCTVDGCERTAVARTWCRTHYERWLYLGEAAGDILQQGQPQVGPCAVPECDRSARKRGWCGPHYDRWLNSGGAEPTGWIGPYGELRVVKYGSTHSRLRRILGLASRHTCVDCGDRAREWSYDHEDPDERQTDGLPYSLDPAHYEPRCITCHRRFDRRHLAG